MKLDEYKEIVKNNSHNDNKAQNMFVAFISGGIIAVIGELIYLFLNNVCNFNMTDSLTITTIVFVVIASVLTGFCVFDKVSSTFKAGILVPITGFAHAMTSSAMDHKDEGLIYGIGCNIFKLTGSVILYGLVAGFLFSLIKGVLF